MDLSFIFPIIAFLIELALIIGYCSMVINIHIIRREIKKLNIPRNDFEYWEAEYEKHRLCNRDKLALYALQEAIYFLVTNSKEPDKNKIYDDMLQRYGDIIKGYGAAFMQRP